MSQYERTLDDIDGIRTCAETHGFCLVRDVFDRTEMGKLKVGMQQLDAEFGKNIPDLMSCAPLDWLILDSRVLRIARALLGEQLVYYPESAVNYEATIGAYTAKPLNELHCDAKGVPDNLTDTWRSATDAIYRGYRFAIYFQDYSQYSGGLKVGVGTHKGDPDAYLVNGGLNNEALVQVETGPGEYRDVNPAYFPLHDVPSRRGDLVIWNLRTIHSAGARVLKAQPEMALHPAVETYFANKAPHLLRSVIGPRLALFFDLAAPTEDVDLYIKVRTHLFGPNSEKSLINARYDAPEIEEKMRIHGVSARYDHLLVHLLIRWFRTPDDRPAIAGRMLRVADRHQEFSPHFPLFDRKEYLAVRKSDKQQALKIVFDGILSHSAELRMKS